MCSDYNSGGKLIRRASSLPRNAAAGTIAASQTMLVAVEADARAKVAAAKLAGEKADATARIAAAKLAAQEAEAARVKAEEVAEAVRAFGDKLDTQEESSSRQHGADADGANAEVTSQLEEAYLWAATRRTTGSVNIRSPRQHVAAQQKQMELMLAEQQRVHAASGRSAERTRDTDPAHVPAVLPAVVGGPTSPLTDDLPIVSTSQKDFMQANVRELASLVEARFTIPVPDRAQMNPKKVAESVRIAAKKLAAQDGEGAGVQAEKLAEAANMIAAEKLAAQDGEDARVKTEKVAEAVRITRYVLNLATRLKAEEVAEAVRTEELAQMRQQCEAAVAEATQSAVTMAATMERQYIVLLDAQERQFQQTLAAHQQQMHLMLAEQQRLHAATAADQQTAVNAHGTPAGAEFTTAEYGSGVDWCIFRMPPTVVC
jgi:hypothetical protein